MKGSELCRVMIVDDETLIRQGIKHYFNWEEEGFLIVGEASNGQEALELLEEVQPHILITDIVMPIMDGEELTKIVKANYPHIEVIVLSSFGEFEYVRSSFQSGVVDYILKPKLDSENLLAVLKTAVQRIPDFQITNKTKDTSISIEQIIDKLITGFDVSENLEAVQKVFPNEIFYLLGVDLSQNPAALAEVKELVQWLFSENTDDAISYFMKAEKEACFYLLNVKDKDSVHVVPKIKECSQRQPKIGFVLTEPFSNFSEIGEMYKRQLLPLFQYRFYVPEKQVVLQSDIVKDKEEPPHFQLEWLTEELKRERFESAFRYIREHGKTLSTQVTMDVDEFKTLINNIIFNVTILLRNIGFDVNELENSKYSQMKQIEEANYAKEVLDFLDRFINEAENCVSNKQSSVENENMKKLLAYISEHYMEPLTLTEVAKHFHFNPSYLSTYFTSHNKEGFSEYLNKIRIDAAIKLLRTSAPISDISAQVGYSDHSYFCKVFKKGTGYSPSQYRRKLVK